MKKFFSSLRTFALAAVTLVAGSISAQIASIPYSQDFEDGTTAPFVGSAEGVAVSNGNASTTKVVGAVNGTATASFAIGEAKGAYTIADGEEVTVSFKMFNGWLGAGKDITVSLVNSEGKSLASLAYNCNNCNFSNVAFGGTTPDGFAAFNGQSWSDSSGKNANGFDKQPFAGTDASNPFITIKLKDNGEVSLNILFEKKSIDNTYTAKLEGVKMDLASITINNPNGNGNRASYIDNLAITTREYADKTLVSYSFDDATNPAVAKGSNNAGRGAMDYYESPIAEGKFLSIWGENNTNATDTIAITDQDVTTYGQWTLEFDFAGYGGCNSKAGYTSIVDAEGNVLFAINDVANWNNTMDLSCGGKIKSYPCNRDNRGSINASTAVLTGEYWSHITLVGSKYGIKANVQAYDAEGNLIEEYVVKNAKSYATNASPAKILVMPGSFSVHAIDNLKLVAGDLKIVSYDYTVKFIDQTGSEWKTAETRNDVEGTALAVTEEDKATVTEGKTQYIYVSDDAAGTLDGEGQVITITYNKKTVSDYTVKFVDAAGNEVKPAATHKNAEVGTEVAANFAELADFLVGDTIMGVKSGNDSITIAENAEDNVITLVFGPSYYQEREVAIGKDRYLEYTVADLPTTATTEGRAGYWDATELGKSGSTVFGNGNVSWNTFADLTGYDKLIVKSTEGTPRFCMNRLADDGQHTNTVEMNGKTYPGMIDIPNNADMAAKYQTVTEEGGVKTTIIDLKKMTEEYGFARLHSMKGANWASTTITSIIAVEESPVKVQAFYNFEDGKTDGWKTATGGRYDPVVVDGSKIADRQVAEVFHNDTTVVKDPETGEVIKSLVDPTKDSIIVEKIVDQEAYTVPFLNKSNFLSVNQANRNNNGATVTASMISVDAENFAFEADFMLGRGMDQKGTRLSIKNQANNGDLLTLQMTPADDNKWIVNGADTITLPNTGNFTGTTNDNLTNYDWYHVNLGVFKGNLFLTIVDTKNNVICDNKPISSNVATYGVGNIEFASSRYNANLAFDNIIVREFLESDKPEGFNPVDVILNYVDAAGTVLKAADTIQVNEGETPEIRDNFKASFKLGEWKYFGEGETLDSAWVDTVKYLYVSDNSADVKAAEGAQVNLVFAEADVIHLQVRGQGWNGATAKTFNDVYGFDQDQIGAYYPRYNLYKGLLYEIPAGSGTYYGATVTLDKAKVQSYGQLGDMQREIFSYSATDIDNVVFYAEAEDIEGMTVVEDNYTHIRQSNGKAGRAVGENVLVTTLEPGTYTATLSTRSGVSNLVINDTVVIATVESGGTVVVTTGEPFSVFAPTEVYAQATDKVANYFDFVYIRKVGDVSMIETDDASTEFTTTIPNITAVADGFTASAVKIATLAGEEVAALASFEPVSEERTIIDEIEYLHEDPDDPESPIIDSVIVASHKETVMTGEVKMSIENPLKAGNYIMTIPAGAISISKVPTEAATLVGVAVAEGPKFVISDMELSTKPFAEIEEDGDFTVVFNYNAKVNADLSEYLAAGVFNTVNYIVTDENGDTVKVNNCDLDADKTERNIYVSGLENGKTYTLKITSIMSQAMDFMTFDEIYTERITENLPELTFTAGWFNISDMSLEVAEEETLDEEDYFKVVFNYAAKADVPEGFYAFYAINYQVVSEDGDTIKNVTDFQADLTTRNIYIEGLQLGKSYTMKATLIDVTVFDGMFNLVASAAIEENLPEVEFTVYDPAAGLDANEAEGKEIEAIYTVGGIPVQTMIAGETYVVKYTDGTTGTIRK